MIRKVRKQRPAPRGELAGNVRREDEPALLARSKVYLKLPPCVRRKLDKALLRCSNSANLRQLSTRFELDKYGISPSALCNYAKKLNRWTLPMATSRLVASLVGCLPAGDLEEITSGGQVLLLSRVAELLSDAEQGLSVTELAKLAAVLRGIGARGSRTTVKRTNRSDPSPEKKSEVPACDHQKLSEAVRLVSGLTPIYTKAEPLNPESSNGPRQPAV
jgi:hypothetical protein